MGGICNVILPGWDKNVWRGCYISVELCLDPKITSGSDQLVGASAHPKLSFYAKILTTKGGDRLILASLASISHQVDLRTLRDPCLVFKSLFKIKPGVQC